MRGLFLLFFFTLPVVAQQTETADFTHIEALIGVDETARSLEADYSVTFEVLRDTDSIYLDAVGMQLSQLKLPPGIRAAAGADKIWITGGLKKDSTYTLSFSYRVSPAQTVYFTPGQVWTQGQGKYTSHWLPSLDDMNDKIEFDLSYLAPAGKAVVANGRCVEVVGRGVNRTWRFDMEHPMSSYLVAFAMGDFDRRTQQSSSGVPIELYFRPQDSLKVEPTYRYTTRIFDFLEQEIGVDYPWSNYKQVPVRDFLYAGMENTTATIFSQAFVVDSTGFNDRNYVNVNAHELAHQWFGNLITETSGTHHWLQEGFATYYAQLAEREIFGADYVYWKLYQSAEQLKELSDEGRGQRLLDPGASSLIFYEKGAWALHLLRDLIGDEAFKRAVRNYLESFRFGNVETQDFLDAVREETRANLSKWERDWLQQTAFPSQEAFEYLSRSQLMQQYFELFNKRKLPFSERIGALAAAIDSGNEYLGQEAVYQLAEVPLQEAIPLYRRALESPNLYIRQAVVLTVPRVNAALRTYFERALEDDSYLTREYALLQLWSAYPAEVTPYLEALEGQMGFQDRNLRQLWLALAIYTRGFRDDEKPTYREELRGYATPDYSFEVRQKAFDYLFQLGMIEGPVIDALVDACVHHQWRFRKAMRERLEGLLADRQVRAYLRQRMPTYNRQEQDYLKTVMTGI